MNNPTAQSIPTGIIRGESITAYHQSGAFGKSSLMDLAKYGPVDFYHRHIAKSIIRDETEALRFGRLFDGLMEDETRERARWGDPIPDDAPRRPSEKQRNAKKQSDSTVDAIRWWDDYLSRNHGKESVNDKDRHILEEMLFAVSQNQVARELWARCEKQVSIRRQITIGGQSLMVQSRPDGLVLDAPEGEPMAPVGGVLVDVKSCRDINRFPMDCLSFGYHVQLALGQWLLAKEGYHVSAVLIAVEKKIKPRCRVFSIPEVALAAGWTKAKALLEDISKRLATGDWSDPQAEVEQINLPDWTVRRLAEEGAEP